MKKFRDSATALDFQLAQQKIAVTSYMVLQEKYQRALEYKKTLDQQADEMVEKYNKLRARRKQMQAHLRAQMSSDSGFDESRGRPPHQQQQTSFRENSVNNRSFFSPIAGGAQRDAFQTPQVPFHSQKTSTPNTASQAKAQYSAFSFKSDDSHKRYF